MIGAFAAKRGRLDAGISAKSTLVIVGLRTNHFKETASSCRLFRTQPKRSCNARLCRHKGNLPPPAAQMFNTSSKFNTYP